MLKDTTYKEKFAILKSWMPSIIDAIKKDLKADHLKQDWQFSKKYFPAKNISKLTCGELALGYQQALEQEENSEAIGEFIANRWLLKHTDLYQYFEEKLRQITPDFSDLKEIDKHKSLEIIDGAVKQFGAPNTYLFSVMNAVVFPEEVYNDLGKKAQEAAQAKATAHKELEEKMSIDKLVKNYELQIARLTDKYEKKLVGFEKKYHQDVQALKKQVANLQRKVTESEERSQNF